MKTWVGPFATSYRELIELEDGKGYEFGKVPNIKNPPPTVTFPKPLKWWSFDRPKRLQAVREMRDRYLQDILRLGKSRKRSDQCECEADESRNVEEKYAKGGKSGQKPSFIEHPCFAEDHRHRAA